jgi:hypothetical protein
MSRAFHACKELKKRFEVTKGVIRNRISKKNRQHNGEKKKDTLRSTKHTHKTKDRVTRTPLRAVGELRCSGVVRSPCSKNGKGNISALTDIAKYNMSTTIVVVLCLVSIAACVSGLTLLDCLFYFLQCLCKTSKH